MQTTTQPPQPEVARVRGTNDFLPPDAARLHGLEERLRRFFELYAYQPVETPVLENLELFLRKSGDEIVARTYSFTHWNRHLCLRPEFTASVMRAYVAGMQERPLPLRLHYAGPTFRYEKPQRGRYRQFTQVGIECIGGAGALAEAEVLRVACGALEALGLPRYRLVLGHLGAVLQLLGQLGLTSNAQTLILGAMEHLGRRGADPAAVAQRILGLLGRGPTEPGADGPEDGAAPLLPEFIQQFGAPGAARVATGLLELGGLPLEGGTRNPDEIVARLLEKVGRSDPAGPVRTAIDFIQQLHERAGPAEQALPALDELLGRFGLDTAPLAEIREALDLFGRYGSRPAEVTVDLSLGRGLWYYTGLVFEAYYDAPGGTLQLCGGGRYDDLVRALGGRESVPACGFAFGLERVDLALTAALGAAEPAPPADVLLAPLADEDAGGAIAAAESLRAAGLRVELETRARGARAPLRRADRLGIGLVALLGEREREAGQIVLRDLRRGDERAVPLADLAAAVREAAAR